MLIDAYRSYLFLIYFILSIWLFLYTRFYLKNINYIFSYSAGKLIVHTFLNVYAFDIETACIKIADNGLISYFIIVDEKTNKKVRFNYTMLGRKNIETLQKNLDELLVKIKPIAY